MKKIVFMCLFFILNFSIMGDETLKSEDEKNLEMSIPEISKFKIFHTISEVNERFNHAQTVVNKHAEAIRQNVSKNKELEKRLGDNENATSQINSSVGDLNNQISEIKNNISNNEKQINNLKNDVNSNLKKMGVRIETLQSIVGLNDQVIMKDRADREEADKKLNSAIVNEKNTREKITAQLSSDINEEKTARENLNQVVEKNSDRIQKLGETTEKSISYLNQNAEKISQVEENTIKELDLLKDKVESLNDSTAVIEKNKVQLKNNSQNISTNNCLLYTSDAADE